MSSHRRAGRSAARQATKLRIQKVKDATKYGAAAAVGVTAAAVYEGAGTASLAAGGTAGVALVVWLCRKPTGAKRWAQGAKAEKRTARVLARLERSGWKIMHDLSIPKSRANIDHLAIHPSGTFAVMVDTKAWHANNAVIKVINGNQLKYGPWDQTAKLRTCEWIAQRAFEELGIPVATVMCIDGGKVEGAQYGATVLGETWIIQSDTLFAALDRMTPEAVANRSKVREIADRANVRLPVKP